MNRPPSRRPLPPPRPAPRRSTGGFARDPRLLLAGGGAALLAIIVLGVLFIGPWSVLNPSNDGDTARFNCPTVKDPPPPPEGLEPASAMRDFSEERCKKPIPAGPAAITLPLEKDKASRGLQFYTYTGDAWQRLAPAELTEDSASGRVVVDRVPENGVLMRRVPGSFQVFATVPAGQALHPEAVRLATAAGGLDFVAAPDGVVNGNLSTLRRGDATLLIPAVRGGGGAEADAVNALVAAPEARSAHAANLTRLVQNNKLDGIELQYTAVDPARRGDFTDLVRQVTEGVHTAGGTVTLTLPLPVKDGTNWNTGAYDWNALGKLVDYIKIAPERDQANYRGVVPDALTYLTGQVDPKKLTLTLSPLAAEKSDTGIRTLTTLEALSIAGRFTIRDRERAAANSDVVLSADNLNQEVAGTSGLTWDAVAATVSFTYRSGDTPRTVWIENVYSAAFKAELARLWGLGGIAIDDASASEALAPIWGAVAPLVENTELPLLQPNSGLLRPEWQVDGRPLQAGRPVVTWRTPAETGNPTVTLIVSEGTLRVQSSQRVTLRPASTGPSVTPTATATAGGSPRPGATPAASPTATATPRR